jgi:transcription-repair coupling factor (superfamily II helicase)
MKIQDLCQLYAMHPKVRALAKTLEEKSNRTIFLEGLIGSAVPMVLASLFSRKEERERRKENSLFLVILNDAEEAGYFYHDLVQMLGDKQVLFFPSSYRRAVKYAQRDAANEILRTEVLTNFSRMEDGGTRNENTLSAEKSHQEKTTADISPSSLLVPRSSLYVVTFPDALAEMVVDQRVLSERTLTLTTGQVISVSDIETTLHDFGFHEVDYVYEPGQFALRGSILDVYSYNSEYPFRIDFFGDEIDSIRTFEVEDQLSRDRREQIEIVPELTGANEQKVSLLTFLPDDAVLVAKDLSYVRDAIDRTYQEGFSQQAIRERMEEATEMEQHEIEQQLRRESQLMTGAQFMADAERFRRILLSRSSLLVPRSSTISFHTKPQPLFHKNFELLMPALEDYRLKGYKLYILADSTKQIERLRDILAEKSDLSFEGVDKTLHDGFVDDDAKLCLFTDHQIFDRFHKYNLKSDKARSGKMALTLKEIQQFEIGDYVVHVDHGVGRFGGLVRMPVTSPTGGGREGAYQEMIKITYQRGDAIYVSIHSLYKVSKYKSQDGGEAPRLSTLGTGQWERLKERTKKHIKDIARDLIKLYAARRREKGFAFSHDTYLQHELEASFLYEDTPDQLKATQDVKADMEQAKPMDRLVCGDVGFGKTEVAVRAAFKAACDGKQVAVMVPTTVLAYQHYRTFSSRLKDMPVRVDYLTRARTAKQTTALLKDLEDGKIDILIGTHKLIGKTVKFRDLGLLIIDEEQKFGVSTKEKLRQMRTNVDTLTMSATPIPRTLQFSLVGARDLSVIQTPPPNRYPIQTEIHTFGAEIIADAINFELSRNGQVYFVNNHISDLQHIAEMIRKYVPDARIAIGHGRMKPEELEQIILDFSNHDYDVLLSTTIVENGIDIPNANTIIINGAHNFGLSDLHQMRGRVGRGNRKAFCYLLAPPLAALPQDSRRRLEALENFSDLGSGINIAMQDLDIRGAGNLLGAEQSGFISDLGYETYQKILNEAMAELRNEDERLEMKNERYDYSKGEKPEAQGNHISHLSSFTSYIDFVADCSLESDLEMYFPDQYVPSDSERMLLYRELDNIRDDRELEAYRTRLIDRFGPVPSCGEELMRVVPLRRLGKQLGCEKIMLKQGRMFLYFVSNPNSPYYQSDAFGRMITYATTNVRRCNLRENNGKRSMSIIDVPTVEEAVKVLTAINQ